MNTLIELYDERAIENVLAADMFRPQRIVYLCPTEVAQSRERQEQIADFFRHRGWTPELFFLEASLYKVDRILRQLLAISEKYPDCALDVTGGSDAELFAAGLFAAKANVRVFTYSRKKNRFYNISGAEFADNLPCNISYSVKDFFLMAGGTLLPGRVDNGTLKKYLDDIDPFFDCFLRYRRDWTNIITYMQRVSPSEYGQVPSMHVQGNYTVKGERGGRICAKEDALLSFERIGFIRALEIVSGEKVSFRFRDANTRAWLRDVGSVLELYVYKACLDAGIFNDIKKAHKFYFNDRMEPTLGPAIYYFNPKLEQFLQDVDTRMVTKNIDATISGVTPMKEVPIWEKANLTLKEAALYFGIGQNKLREMTDMRNCNFVLVVGTKRLIKRKQLEKYLENTTYI